MAITSIEELEERITLSEEERKWKEDGENTLPLMISPHIMSLMGNNAIRRQFVPSVKENVLGVKHETIEKYGTVSSECALEMAEGVRKLTASDYSLSVTGVAGPDKDEGKDVGTVYLGFSAKDGRAESVLLRFSSWGRESIRRKAAVSAFLLLSSFIKGESVSAIVSRWKQI